MQSCRTRFLFLAACLALLAGCAASPSKSLDPNDRRTLTKIKVQHDVDVVSPVYLYGNPVAQTVGAFGGVIGAIADQEALKAGKTEVGAFAKANGFSVAEIAKAEFIRASAQKGGMTFSESESSPDGILILSVDFYGFGQANGLGRQMYPVMRIKAIVKRLDGSVAWEATDFVTPLNGENNPGYEYAEYILNPGNVREALARAAGIVSRGLVSQLYK